MISDPAIVEYAARKGWTINQAGLIQLTKEQAASSQYIGTSLTDPTQRTLVVAGHHGCTLLFENIHFIIV